MTPSPFVALTIKAAVRLQPPHNVFLSYSTDHLLSCDIGILKIRQIGVKNFVAQRTPTTIYCGYVVSERFVTPTILKNPR